MVIFTYSRANRDSAEDRWDDQATESFFFSTVQAARRAVLDIRREVLADSSEAWTPVVVERVETVPLTEANIITLLNEGLGSFVKSYKVVETVG